MVDQLIYAFWAGAKGPLIILIVGLGPLACVGWYLHSKKAEYKAHASDPFTEFPLRPPGESLRLKIEELTESFDDLLYNLAAASVGFAIVLISTPEKVRNIAAIGGLACIVIVYTRNIPKLAKTAQKLWDYRLGFMGERVVGEELNQLMLRGHRVFHDIPFDGFNIDHVIVSEQGVYAIETKSPRKPAHVKGAERATLIYDGSSIQFPMGRSSAALDQARRNSSHLSRFLENVTAQEIKVSPIVTFPGWFVERLAKGDVNVLNPSEIKRSFPKNPLQVLSPKLVEQIAFALSEKCRLKPE